MDGKTNFRLGGNICRPYISSLYRGSVIPLTPRFLCNSLSTLPKEQSLSSLLFANLQHFLALRSSVVDAPASCFTEETQSPGRGPHSHHSIRGPWLQPCSLTVLPEETPGSTSVVSSCSLPTCQLKDFHLQFFLLHCASHLSL